MADRLVVTSRESERGVHETARRPGRAGGVAGAGAVREYVGYEEWAEQGFMRREVARQGVALILAFGDGIEVYEDEIGSPVRTMGAFVVGAQTRSSLTGVGGHQMGVQVELTPAGALGLFGKVEALTDTVAPIDEVLGGRGASLAERLAETPSWRARLDLLDESLGNGAPARLSPEVDWLRRQLLASRGQARVEPLMDETGWSRRHVTQHFRHQLGLPPKAYARLLRFEHATSLLTADGAPSLAETAMAAGYYDQSHLTRDFVALAGVTPGAYAADAALVPEVRFVQDGHTTDPAE